MVSTIDAISVVIMQPEQRGRNTIEVIDVICGIDGAMLAKTEIKHHREKFKTGLTCAC